MIECSGTSLNGICEAVTGRIWQIGQTGHGLSDSARIIFWNGEDELTDVVLRGAVGVVFPQSLETEKCLYAARIAEFRRLPALKITRGAMHDRNADGKIAIMDTDHGKLYVNPDLETINAYFGASSKKKPRSEPTMICSRTSTGTLLPHGFDGLVVGEELPYGTSEDRAYDLFCDAADKHTGVQLIATADLGGGANDFLARVRAIYRASIWGRFSLLCKGIVTGEQLRQCVSLIHHAFCSLDSEYREFNGFIRKGAVIDTPLLLLGCPTIQTLDFFLIDIERVRRLLTATDDQSIGLDETLEYTKVLADSTPHADISLKISSKMTDSTLSSLISKNIASELYLPASDMQRIKRML